MKVTPCKELPDKTVAASLQLAELRHVPNLPPQFVRRPKGTAVRPSKRRTAAATVEFALIVPLLALLLLGMLELDRAMAVKCILSNAARKACRTGIQRDKGNTDILAEAVDVMNDNSFGASKFNPPALGSVTVTVTDPSGNTLGDSLDAPSGSVVSVQVSIPVSSTTWVTPFYLASGASLESETIVMMKQ